VAHEASLVLNNGRLQTPFAEAYRALRANISITATTVGVRSLLVTSGGAGEGKSTTAANLAILMAQAGRRVMLVDADFRRPSLSRLFPVTSNGHANGSAGFWKDVDAAADPRGLCDLVQQTATYAEVCRPVAGIDNLSLIPTGAIPSNPAELLASARMRLTVVDLCDHADVVVFDSPPCSLYADAVELTQATDGLLYILRAGPQGMVDHQRILKQLQRGRARLIGVVLNQVDGGIGDYHDRRPNGGSPRG
jgi:capsular exopolysaccharide synthesis family protein